MNETLGQRIQRLRLEKAMTQEELAQRIAGPNRGMVSKWESDSDRPTIDHLQGLSRVLGISLDELITGESSNKTEAAITVKVKVEGLNELENLKYMLGDIRAILEGMPPDTYILF